MNLHDGILNPVRGPFVYQFAAMVWSCWLLEKLAMSDPYKFKNMLSCDCPAERDWCIAAVLQDGNRVPGDGCATAPDSTCLRTYSGDTRRKSRDLIGPDWYFCSSSFSTCSETGFVCHVVRVWIWAWITLFWRMWLGRAEFGSFLNAGWSVPMYVLRCLDVFGMRWFGNGCETTDMGLSQDENCAIEPGYTCGSGGRKTVDSLCTAFRFAS